MVRTQDSDNPNPVDGPNAYIDPKTRYYYDHSDHYYASLFAKDALHSYVKETGARPEFWIYRGYNISGDPVNVDSESTLAKDWMFYYYALNDYYWFWDGSVSKCAGPRTVTDPNMTGTLDRFVWPGTSNHHWIQRQYATRKALPQ